MVDSTSSDQDGNMVNAKVDTLFCQWVMMILIIRLTTTHEVALP